MSQNARRVGPKSKTAYKAKYLNSPIHNELLKRLKVKAIEEETTISALIHGMLCREFVRPDLADDIPEPRPMPAVAS